MPEPLPVCDKCGYQLTVHPKTAALFPDSNPKMPETAVFYPDNNPETPRIAELYKKKQKQSKAAIFLNILGVSGIFLGICFIFVIFTGEFYNIFDASGESTMEMDRLAGIIGAPVSIGLGILFSYMAVRINAAVKYKQELENSGALQIELLDFDIIRQKRKCRILRIIHYILLITTVISFILFIVLSATGLPDSEVEPAVIVFVVSLQIFIPFMIIYLVSKRKLKKLEKSSYGQS